VGRVGGAVPRGRRAAAAAVAGAVLAVVAVPLPPAGAVDIDGARNQAAALQADLDTAAARYEEVWAAVERATFELEEIERRAGELTDEAEELDLRLAARAREVFKHGPRTGLELLIAEGGPADAIERAGFAAVIQDRETASLEEAQSTRLALQQTLALAEVRRAELADLEAEAEVALAALTTQLDAARRRVRSLEALAARQRLIQNARQSGLYSCIMDRGYVSFRDTWGAPRSGGRRHQGTDVMAPFNVPVYAFTSGVVLRGSTSRLGGVGLYLRGDDGATYYYAHLNGYTAAGSAGRRVVAGEQIGYNGYTGNASRSAPHVHFERRSAGGGKQNPYAYLVAACR